MCACGRGFFLHHRKVLDRNVSQLSNRNVGLKHVFQLIKHKVVVFYSTLTPRLVWGFMCRLFLTVLMLTVYSANDVSPQLRRNQFNLVLKT